MKSLCRLPAAPVATSVTATVYSCTAARLASTHAVSSARFRFLLAVRNGQLEFGHRRCADGHLPHPTGGEPRHFDQRQCSIRRMIRRALAALSRPQCVRPRAPQAPAHRVYQLAAIDAAPKSAHWKRVRKQKLRDRVNAIITEAEEAAARLAPPRPACGSINRTRQPLSRRHNQGREGGSHKTARGSRRHPRCRDKTKLLKYNIHEKSCKYSVL